MEDGEVLTQVKIQKAKSVKETMKSIIYAIIFVITLGILFASCSQKQETKSTKTIGVSLLTRAHVFYKDLEEGLKTEAAKNGYELIITAGEFD